MTDNNDDKTLSVTGKKTLTLKPSGMSQGTVRQDMGRGRTKAVVVETRKRRPIRPEDDKPAFTAPAPAAPRAAEPAAPAQRPPHARSRPRRLPASRVAGVPVARTTRIAVRRVVVSPTAARHRPPFRPSRRPARRQRTSAVAAS